MLHKRCKGVSMISRGISFGLLALTSVALLLLPGTTLAQTALTLEQAVQKALQDNPTIASGRLNVSSAEFNIKSVAGAFFPSLSTEYSYAHLDHERPSRDFPASEDDQFEWLINIHQDLFTGFRLLSQKQRAQLSKEYAELNLDLAELLLILSVQENYFNLLQAREQVLSAEASVTRLRSQLQVSQAFYDVGLTPRLDVLEAEVDLANAEDTLLQARNAVSTQNVRLNTLLGMPHDAEVVYEGEFLYSPFTLEIGQLLEQAYANRPDLKLAQKSVEIALEDADIAKSGLFPQVGADLTWYSQGSDPLVHGDKYSRTEFSAWQAGVSARWNVFDWGETYYGWKAAQENAKRLEAEVQSARLEAVYEVKSRYLDIQEGAERIGVARKALESAQESYRMAVARYQAQVGTNTDVLIAQEGLTTAEANLTNARADYQIAVARLFYSIGQKNPALLTQ